MLSEGLQALGLVGECRLCPRLAVDGGLHLIFTRVNGSSVGEQGRYVHPTDLTEQFAQMFAQMILLNPVAVLGGLTA